MDLAAAEVVHVDELGGQTGKPCMVMAATDEDVQS